MSARLSGLPVFCLAVVFLLGAGSLPALSYEGVMAPAEEETSGGSDGGYTGVIAPTETPRARTRAEAPLGYRGVVPGDETGEDGEKVNAPRATSKDRPKNMTPRPGQSEPMKAVGVESLEMMAILKERGKDLRQPQKLSPAMKRILESNAKENKGTRGALGNMVAGKIALMMPLVEDTSIPPEQRKENARRLYRELSELADGLRGRNAVPDEVYHKIGLSQDYIEQRRLENSSALTVVNAALTELKKY